MNTKTDMTESQMIGVAIPSLSAEDVTAYLHAHPEFLLNDETWVSHIVPPSMSTGHNVLDMQQFMITRLQSQVRTLRDIQSELIEASSLNSLAREQVHQAALYMLDARCIEDIIDYISNPEGLAKTLGTRAATICIESPRHVAAFGINGLRVLEPGGVDRILGAKTSYRLVANVEGSASLYGELASDVRSEALVRLNFSPASPPGLLALGAYEGEQFHPEQAGDLLEFLSRIVERCIARWLDLPPTK